MGKKLFLLMLILSSATECMFSGWFSGKKPEAIYSLSDSNGFALGVDKVTTVKSADGQREIHALYDMTPNHLGDFIVIKSKGLSGYEIKSDKGGPLFDQLVQLVAKKNNITIQSSFAPYRTSDERASSVSEIKEISEDEAKRLVQGGVPTVTSTRIDLETVVPSKPTSSMPSQSQNPIPTKESYEGGLTIEEIQEDFSELIANLGFEFDLIWNLYKRT